MTTMKHISIIVTFCTLCLLVHKTHAQAFDSLLPLTDDKMELIATCAQLSSTVYDQQASEALPGVSYFQDPPEDGDLDAALILEEDSRNRCIVAYRGTRGNIQDWLQNLGPGVTQLAPRTDPGESCTARRSFVEAGGFGISGFATTISEQLMPLIDGCIARGNDLVFTGHSQGGAVALLLHLYFSGDTTPLTVSFGAPPSFDFQPVPDVCTAVPNDHVWRFINTQDSGIGTTGMDYDAVPFTYVLSGSFRPGSGTSGSHHKGSAVLLPATFTNGVRIYNDQTDFPLPLTTSLGFVEAHDHRTYVSKVMALRQLPVSDILVDGFVRGERCNRDGECGAYQTSIGNCNNAVGGSFTCVSGLENDPCFSTVDCESGLTCENTWIRGRRCRPKRPDGSFCNEDNDCLSGRCNNFRFRCVAVQE